MGLIVELLRWRNSISWVVKPTVRTDIKYRFNDQLKFEGGKVSFHLFPADSSSATIVAACIRAEMGLFP